MDLKDCWNWQAVPENFEDLCEWAHLAKNKEATDRRHCHYLLYSSPPDANEVFVVTVRLQGFVEKCIITPHGDWNG
jgi:hypothetical protein